MSKSRLSALLLIVLFIAQCTGESYKVTDDSSIDNRVSPEWFAIPEQKVSSEDIKSIQFYRSGSVNNSPILKLNTNEQLELSFDHLAGEEQQFRIEFTHRNPDWTQSNLPPEWFIQGLRSAFITGGIRSRNRDISYFHYTTKFPNNTFKFLVSGNYLVHVYDAVSNQEVFTLPFFVHENTGTITSRTETIFNNRRDGRAEEQLFSIYNYPNFVQFPQFDLSFRFVQNRLWGTAKKPAVFDTSVEGEIEFHLSRDQLYLADFEFNILDLEDLRDPRRFLDFNPASEPQTVRLREDVQNFAATPVPVRRSRFGSINNDRNARYISTTFSLLPRRILPPETGIYLVGDFNQWQIDPAYKLQYDANSALWNVEALIKQGVYAYKYVQLSSTDMTPFSIEDGFTRQQQEYASLIYFLDPNRQFYRLLQVQELTGK